MKKTEKNEDLNEQVFEFIQDVEKKVEDLDESNEVAEDIAKEIFENNIDSLKKELLQQKELYKDKAIEESFFRGIWIAYFLLGNSKGKDFLLEEYKNIKEFNNKMREREGSFE
jgi:hypothetical protein